jgi:hypothetical protein
MVVIERLVQLKMITVSSSVVHSRLPILSYLCRRMRSGRNGRIAEGGVTSLESDVF